MPARLRAIASTCLLLAALGCAQKETPKSAASSSVGSQPASPSPSATASTWEVTGTMGDACQCEVFCPCEFSSHPSFGNCDDAGILTITKGHYKDVDLSGQKVVVVSASPQGQRLVDAVGNLTFARIYVPRSASDAQAEALGAIVRNLFGTFVGKSARISPDEKVVRADVAISTDSTRYTAKIPGILDLDMKPVVGGDGKTPVVVHNNAFTALGFSDVAVWQSQKYMYTAEGRKWNYAGRSASLRSFSLKG
jgi:hypothetical protein